MQHWINKRKTSRPPKSAARLRFVGDWPAAGARAKRFSSVLRRLRYQPVIVLFALLLVMPAAQAAISSGACNADGQVRCIQATAERPVVLPRITSADAPAVGQRIAGAVGIALVLGALGFSRVRSVGAPALGDCRALRARNDYVVRARND